MKVPKHLFLATLLSSAGIVGSPAYAAPYTMTFTGVVQGVDTLGVFGTAGQDLSQVTFTSQFIYDSAQFGNADVYDSKELGDNLLNGGNELYITGGSSYGNRTDPIKAGWLTINGITHVENGHYWAQLGAGGAYLRGSEANSAADYLGTLFIGSSKVADSLTVLQSFSVATGTNGQDAFVYNGEVLYLEATSVSVTAGTATPPSSNPISVPEPASLTLLAGTLGLLGFASRRPRTTPKALPV